MVRARRGHATEPPVVADPARDRRTAADAVVAWGEALPAADGGRAGEAGAVGPDETPSVLTEPRARTIPHSDEAPRSSAGPRPKSPSNQSITAEQPPTS